MKIIGGNLGDCDVELKKLTEWYYVEDPESIRALQYLEKLFFLIQEQAKTTQVSEFLFDGDHVCIVPGMVNHRCSNDIEVLKTISKFGILASEWFGVLESEREGRYCAFVDRIKPADYRDMYDNYRRLKSPRNDVVLFFDTNNELMQYLLHLDYFEYEKLKKVSPEKLKEVYLPEEIELFEKLIEPMSPSGKDFHDDAKKNSQNYYWSAVPGGIPSILVNGICLKNKQYSDEYIRTLINLFPNATIFNGELQIIYKPKKAIEEEKKINAL